MRKIFAYSITMTQFVELKHWDLDMGLLAGKKAVIFDLDGTVVDSLGVWSDVDVRLARALGVKDVDINALNRLREKTLAQFRNDPSPYTRFCGEFGKFVGSPLSAEEIHATRYRISREVLKTDVKLRAGVSDVIRHLKNEGLRLCVATTTKKANIDIYSDVNTTIRNELLLREYFEFFITIENVERIKPDPECYFLALSQLNLRPEEALVVEDSRTGLLAAKAAGIDTLIVREQHSEHDREFLQKNALAYFEDFSQLLAAL